MFGLFPKKKIQVTLPDDTRVIAIGDIHGQLDRLTKVMELVDQYVEKNPIKNEHIVFLGDYTDRGPRSAEVVEYLTNRQLAALKTKRREIFIQGNHEDLVQEALADLGTRQDLWWRNGGLSTVSSYLNFRNVQTSPDASNEELLRLFRENYPEKHAAFMQTLSDYVQIGPLIFVHAGLRMDQDLKDQSTDDMHWIRDPFLHWSGEPKDYLIVHGHSITNKMKPEIFSHRVGIDTGSYKEKGSITAAIFEKNHVQFLSNGTRKGFVQTIFS